jgi:aspartyl-tRNA(Asn)/glutamyl-tRNA(Gln) amidotransferase subunit A
VLRNPTLINFLDGCALSVPCHAPGSSPVGMMIAGSNDADRASWRSEWPWKIGWR